MSKYKGKNDYMKIIDELLNIHDVKERAKTIELYSDYIVIEDKNGKSIIEFKLSKDIYLNDGYDYICYNITFKDDKYVLEEYDRGILI